MHAVFLAASKAFDQVHMKLFEKLIQRKVKMCFVHLQMEMNRDKHLSEPLHVINAVRQRAILSPYFYAVCLDDLSKELNNILEQGVIFMKSH